MMRKAVGIALAALAALFFFLLIPTAAPEAGETNAGAEGPSFGIYSSEIANSGNGSVAVLRMFLFGADGGEALVFCSEPPIQKNMLILSHAQAPGVGSGLSSNIAHELAACGFSSRDAGLEDALGSQNAVIIAPTGATPAGLAEKSQELEESNSRVIVLESLAGRVIGTDGALSAGGTGPGFETVQLVPGEEGKAAKEAARLAMVPFGANAVKTEGRTGNFTIAVPVSSALAYCRAAYIGSAGECRHADSGALLAPPGSLIGPEKALAGKDYVFEFSLEDGSEAGRRLRFFAATYAGQNEVARKEIAGGEIKGNFASRFALNFSSGGKYVVRILDQFSRLHAAAYVEVAGLDARMVSQEGNRYEYFVLFGGEGADGKVEAWIDSGEPKEYYAAGGKLVIWAAPSQGKHTMNFEHRGLRAHQDFEAAGGGLAETYLRLGAPALVFLFAVYFLLRAGKKAKYTITFPQFAERELEVIDAAPDEIECAWERADGKRGGFGLAAYPEEIAKALDDARHGAADSVSAHSVFRVLRALVKQGRFAESGGGFIPASRLGGFTAGETASLRLLHDLLLERGVAFARSRRIVVKSSGIELALFQGKNKILEKIGRLRRAVVFGSREELEAFEESLDANGKEDVRIKIALANGKVVFVPAARAELEAILL